MDCQLPPHPASNPLLWYVLQYREWYTVKTAHTMTHFSKESIKTIGDNFCIDVNKVVDEYDDYDDEFEEDGEEGEHCRIPTLLL